MTTPATEPTAPRLSDEQRRIIAHRGGHLQVVACAGSGKTETVAQRVAALLAEGVAPCAVVAFTFTRAAADELRSRIHRRVAERLPDLALERLAPMFVGTIHAYCLRLLQERAPRFATFDLYDAHRVIGLLLREYDDLGLAALETRGRVQTVRGFLRSVDVVENEDLDVTAALPDGPFRDVYQRYLELLDRYHVLTHAQCVARALRTLEDDDVLASVHATLRHLVVDEFQDINPSQARLIRRLGTGPVSLCVVGDDDQAIYQWRGSSVAYLQTFQSETGAVRETLGVNRRSVSNIVSVAARFAETISGRLSKTIAASRGEGPCAVNLSGARDPLHEAARVAQAIRALLDRGTAPGDVAILLRSTKNDAAPFLAALSESGVPWRCTGREGLFFQPEAEVLGDLLAWLCGRDTFHRARLGREVSIALDELLDRLGVTFARSPEELAALRAQLLSLRTALPQEPAADLVAHLYDVLASLGVRAWEGDVERLGVLARVSQILADFEAVTRRAWTTVTDGVMHVGEGHAGGPVFLRALADYLSFYAQSAYEDFAGDLDATTPAVTVSTVHGAKGLQWPVVFVPCLNRGVFPSRMTGRKGSWMLPRGSFPAARYEGSDDDERRLFYVAMTRARDHLYLSLHQRDDQGDAARASPLLQALLPGGISVSDAALPLPEVVPPATSASDERPRVSYSALASYLRCPYQHWLSSRIGFASPTARKGGYGRAVHHLLRRLAEHLRATGRDPTGDEVDALFAREFYLPNGDQDAYDALERRARAIVKTALSQWRDDLARVWAVERPLELHLDVADLEGRADVILDREDGVEGQLALVDYKTRPVQQDDEAAQQLRVYAAAARGEGFTVRAAYLHDLTASKASARHPVDVSAEAVTASLASLSGSLVELRARRFEGRPGVQCGRCELRAICRYAPKSDSA
ncbi:MAG: ATP-dependent DNA helicase [Polyangiales bacterium]